MDSNDRRPLIGGIAVVLLVFGFTALQFPQFVGSSADTVSAGCIRIGSIMGALWLAYRDLHRIPSWMWTGLIVVLAIIALRPRAALVIIPVLITIWMVMPKRPRQPKGQS